MYIKNITLKKLLLISLTILSFGSLSAQKDIVKMNLISPFSITGSFFYERVIAKRTSFQLGLYYTGLSIKSTKTRNTITTKTTTKFRGFGITPEFRFYASEEALIGFYVAPFLRYQNLSITNNDGKANLTTYGAGLVLGKQIRYFRDRITVDVFIGPCINNGDVDVKSGSDPDYTFIFNGFGVRTGITAGFIF